MWGRTQLPEASCAANQLAEALHKPGVQQMDKQPNRIPARPLTTGPRPLTPARKKWTSYSCLDDDDDRLMHI